MENERKKQLIAAYKQRRAAGGLHLLENIASGRCLLLPTPDVAGAENRFAFARKTKTPPHPKVKDWGDGSGFRITLLDTLEKEEDWDNRQYREQLQALAALWREKLEPREWY